jgi:hypothetical protein
MLDVFVLSVVMLDVVMLSVVVLKRKTGLTDSANEKQSDWNENKEDDDEVESGGKKRNKW